MVKDDVIKRITEIGTADDITQIRDSLAQFADDLATDYDRYAGLEAANEKLVKDNDTLREYNMKLFLRVGEEKTKEDVTKAETGINDPVPVKRKFEDLFTEKGAIK